MQRVTAHNPREKLPQWCVRWQACHGRTKNVATVAIAQCAHKASRMLFFGGEATFLDSGAERKLPMHTPERMHNTLLTSISRWIDSAGSSEACKQNCRTYTSNCSCGTEASYPSTHAHNLSNTRYAAPWCFGALLLRSLWDRSHKLVAQQCQMRA